MLQVNVPGGANSGKKLPLQPPKPDWRCVNGHDNRGYATRCLADGCREQRP